MAEANEIVPIETPEGKRAYFEQASSALAQEAAGLEHGIDMDLSNEIRAWVRVPGLKPVTTLPDALSSGPADRIAFAHEMGR